MSKSKPFNQSVTVIIHTKNSAQTLARTLDSVEWADEVLVVDMHSTDETVSIAKAYQARVELVADVGYVEPARNTAITLAKSSWICIVDSDEVITKELAEKLTNLAQGDATSDAYWIPRKNIVFGGWLHTAGWWPDYQLRFFKKGVVSWPEKIHAVPRIDGSIDYLPTSEDLAIVHYNYTDVSSFIDRLNRYTTHELQAQPDQDAQSVTESSLIKAWSSELFSRLFVHKGLNGGVRGVGVSFLQTMYQLAVQLKKWEEQEGTKEVTNSLAKTMHERNPETAIREMEQFSSDLRYWIAHWHVERTSGATQLWWRIRRSLKM